jgi:hypothetical protein
MIKQIVTITVLLLAVFFGTYFLTGYAVDKILGDEVYGQDVEITAEVDGLKVKPYFGEQKPNFKVQETQDPQWGMR